MPCRLRLGISGFATNDQELDNVIPFPYAPRNKGQNGSVVKFERLGGLLNYYHQENGEGCRESRKKNGLLIIPAVTCGDGIAKIDPSVATILNLKYFPSVFANEISKILAG